MGLKELFAKPGVPDKEPVLRDRSTILAYLEELCHLRTSVMLWINKDDLLPVSARVDLVGDEAGTFTLQLQRSLPADIDPRFPVEMLFPLDGMRFRCPIRFVERSGYMKAVFRHPDTVLHAERRGRVRTRFGQRENASVTVLESLAKGHGASGKLLDLGLEGLCVRLEKAISIEDNRRLAIHANLFRPQQELMVVRILDLPHSPLVECAGTVMHIEAHAGGVTLGIRLDGVGTLESRAISEVLTRRVPTFRRGFPQRRRHCELGLEEERATPAETRQETGDGEAPGAAESTPAEESAAKTGPQSSSRLEHLRKRARRILLVQVDDLDRSILAGTLLVDGFTQVKEARNFAEAIRHARAAPIDLILIEPQIGAIPVQTFLANLRRSGHCEEVPAVLLADQPDMKTAIMAKTMQVAHVQKRPIDYDGELRNVIYGLMKLARD